MHIRVVRFLKFSRGDNPEPPSRRESPAPGPTPSTAEGASGRAGRASRAQPPPYANPCYATGESCRIWSIADLIINFLFQLFSIS
jgi:hypothetical protein